MRDYEPTTFGDKMAERYDSWFPHVDPHMIERLSQLSRRGKVLELGIGTGRVALPLRQRGVEMHGVDASPAMVEKMRLKEGGEDIPVKICSFAEFELEDKFTLVFVVFNTFFGLLTQREQVSCFRSVSRVLESEGTFVMEAFVPDLGRFDRGQAVRTGEVSPDYARIECALHDRNEQRVSCQVLEVREGAVTLQPIKLRYAWPSEIDLMAELSGMRRIERWGGWQKEPFTDGSGAHISVYGK